MKKIFTITFLMIFLSMGLFLSPIVAADNPNAIVGEWVRKSNTMTNTLLFGTPTEKDGELSVSLINSESDGNVMLYSHARGKIIGTKISFVLYSLHPDGCGGVVVSGEVGGIGAGEEMILLFSPLPPSIACSSDGNPFIAVFKRISHSSLVGGPAGGVPDRGGHPVGGGAIK